MSHNNFNRPNIEDARRAIKSGAFQGTAVTLVEVDHGHGNLTITEEGRKESARIVTSVKS